MYNVIELDKPDQALINLEKKKQALYNILGKTVAQSKRDKIIKELAHACVATVIYQPNKF